MKKMTPKRRSPSLLRSKRAIHVGEKHISQDETPYTRRTVSISPQIHKWIQDYRADLMKSDPNLEYEYTTIANYLMAYGIRFITTYEVNTEDHTYINDMVGKKLLLGRHGIVDALDNLDRFIDDEEDDLENSSDSVKGKKKDDVPEA